MRSFASFLPFRRPRQEAAQQPSALGLSRQELQDVVCCLLLSETVYKSVEGSLEAAVAALNELRRQFPTRLAPLTAVQFCRRSAEHRYMLGASGTTLYVCFMGTKQPRDYWADANLLTALLWQEAAGGGGGGGAAPAAHRGFLGRAAAVQAEALWAHARARGLRLVLCGHSLGGAVAQLCTLRLLRLLRGAPPPPRELRCVVFGAPAIGNSALAGHVASQGWDQHFQGIALPEDVIPRLFLLAPGAQASLADTASAEAVLDAAEGEVEGGQEQEQELAEAGLTSSGGSTPPPGSLQGHASPPAGNGSRGAAGWRAAQAARAAAQLAQRPISAAAGVAAVAARTARAGAARLRPPPLLPAFAHIGQQQHLLSRGLVPAAAGVAAAATPAGGGEAPAAGQQALGQLPPQQPPQQPAQQRQLLQLQLLGLHSMQHYRARAAAACWAALGRPPADEGEADEPAVELSASLAPAVAVQHAAARLPVLPPLQGTAGASGRPAAAVPAPPRQGSVVLRVSVAGQGLEGCTAALLRFPGAGRGRLPATAVANLARERLLLELERPAGGGGGGSDADGGGASLPAAIRAASERAWGWGAQHLHLTRQQQGPGPAAQLLLEFAVPAAAAAALQLDCEGEQGGGWRLPRASLQLLSDFARHSCEVELQPQSVWLLSLHPALGAGAWQQLGAAAAAAAAAAAGSPQPVQPGWRRPSAAGWASAAGGLLPWGRGPAGGASGTDVAAPAPSGGGGSSSNGTGLPQGASSAGQRLAQFKEGLASRVRQLAGGEEPAAPPALLLRGQLLLDVTEAALGGAAGPHAVPQQLELAAEVVRWVTAQLPAAQHQQQQQQQQHGKAASGGQAQGWEEAVEAEEEDSLAQQRQLGLGARVRRSVAAAGAAARRRAALLRRRHGALDTLPPPDLLVLLLDRRQLLSGAYGQGLDAAVLAAVRQLAAACHACGGCPLLLGVAAHTPLTTPTRHQLASSCGLAEDGGGGGSRRGGVVPLLWQAAPGRADDGDSVHVGPLHTALYAYGRTRQREEAVEAGGQLMSRL